MAGLAGRKLTALIIDDEPEIREVLSEFVGECGCTSLVAENTRVALSILQKNNVDVVFSDIHMPGKSGIQFLADLKEVREVLPSWIFISADGSPETLLKATRLGAVDILQKPFQLDQIQALLQRIGEHKEDATLEIMDIVQKISGIKLGRDKKLLVETRLMRRARVLGLDSVGKYKDYFKKHRDQEVDELISAITTHTTSFFREPDHFDFLYDQVFPILLQSKEPIRIWSAASSTGEEVYSMAISLLEYLREKNIPISQVPPIQILGTDIDFNSVQIAGKGVYEFEKVEKLHPHLIKKYFQVGTNELSGFVRVNDDVHKLCRFEQFNLLSENYPVGQYNVVFCRNVLIYFQSEQVKEIGRKILKSMTPEGFLFLGHSESFNGMGLPYRMVGNSIYRSIEAKPLASMLRSEAAPLIRTLIVDDSMTVRKMLAKILSPEDGFQVVGEAANPLEADQILASKTVDLITLDIHMPVMDGITYLQKLRGKSHPPIVMISSISYQDAVSSLQCFELGAVDYIEKPSGMDLNLEAERIRLVLKGASAARRQSRLVYSEDRKSEVDYRPKSSDLIVIGASTGGTEAIKNVLLDFPENSPPALIVQHMPAHFTKAFAQRLNEICKVRVHEAGDGMAVEHGNVYIAPGGQQMKIQRFNDQLRLQITSDPPLNRHRPSVDYLFDSVVSLMPEKSVTAIILTGMGGDGARGLKKLRDAGAHTIVQNEETCVVFGMPNEAIRLGAAIEVLPLPSIAYHIFKSFKARRSAA